MVQWLRLYASSAEVLGLVLGQWTRSHRLQLKISHAAAKTQGSLIQCANKKKTSVNVLWRNKIAHCTREYSGGFVGAMCGQKRPLSWGGLSGRSQWYEGFWWEPGWGPRGNDKVSDLRLEEPVQSKGKELEYRERRSSRQGGGGQEHDSWALFNYGGEFQFYSKFHKKTLESFKQKSDMVWFSFKIWELPWWLSGKESACQCRGHRFGP